MKFYKIKDKEYMHDGKLNLIPHYHDLVGNNDTDGDYSRGTHCFSLHNNGEQISWYSSETHSLREHNDAQGVSQATVDYRILITCLALCSISTQACLFFKAENSMF